MMLKDIVIVGTGNFACLMYRYLQLYDQRKVIAFSVEKEYINLSQFEDLPVYPFEELPSYCPPHTYDIMLAIGTSDMNKLRERLFNQCKQSGYTIASFIHPSCTIAPDAKIGEGNIFLEKNMIQPFVQIGDGNLFWDNISISHNDKVGNFNTIAGGVGIAGFTTIKNYCYLGRHSMVFDKVTIADFTLVGAGAYVKRDTNSYDVIVPARSVTLEGKKSTDFKV